jgi:ribonuclease HII
VARSAKIPNATAPATAPAPQVSPTETVRKRLSWKFERAHWKRGIFSIVGVDEAGRGPLAGPVVAGAVYFEYDKCLNFPKSLRDLNDSKQLTEEERERFYTLIIKHAAAIGLGIVEADEIDRINILKATMKAMTLAVESVAEKLRESVLAPEMLLVDGNYFRTTLPYEYQTIVDGDAKSPLIAAASVMAKVTRDRIMKQMHERYPHYRFDTNKGYSTAEHIRLLKEHGPCPEHRRSFRPERFNQEELIFETVVSDEMVLTDPKQVLHGSQTSAT